jgi:membrane protein YqaA with SNARE-associated domain
VARTPFLLFVAMVFFAKAVRYLVVAGVISLFW